MWTSLGATDLLRTNRRGFVCARRGFQGREKRMTSRLKLAGLVAALIIGLSASVAQAGPISGSISISGNFLPVNSAGELVSLDVAQGLDFIDLFGSDPTWGFAGDFFVNSAKGDLAAAAGKNGFMEDLLF